MIHLSILTITIEEWDQRIPFLVCRIFCRYLFVGFNFIHLFLHFQLRGPVAGSTTRLDVLSLGATKNYISKALKCTHFYFTTGYSTHMIGKWHLGFCSWSYTPLYRGFDSFYGIYLGAGDHYTHETAGILDLHDNETPVENKDGVYSTYLYAEVWNNNRFLCILFFFFFSFSCFTYLIIRRKEMQYFLPQKKSSGS